MIRTLLTTTAVALLLSAPALAQENAQPADPNAAPVANDAGSMAPSGGLPLLKQGYVAAADDHLASRLMGQPVYNSASDDAEQIGDINDLVLDADGNIAAVVIGVGGFLGIGEKNVAVDYSNIQWVTAEDNTERLVVPTSKDELTAAAEFTWPDDNATAASDSAANTNVAVPLPADANGNAAEQSAQATPVPADNMNAADGANANVAANNSMAAPAETPAPADDQANVAANSNMAPAENAAPADNAASDQSNVAVNQSPADQGLQGAQPTAANPNAAPLDYSNMTAVSPADLTTADELIGTKVVGPENQQIAEVGDIVLTPDGKIDALLVDFGGFLGIGEKRVAVGMENLRFVTDENNNKYVFVNATKEQLEAAPAYDQASYADNRDAQRLVVSN